MGWTVTYGDSRKDVIQYLTKGWESEKAAVKCLAKQFKGNAFSGTLYGVFETTPKDGSKPYRWIFVALMRYYPTSKTQGQGGWGYKDMDETCGPCEVSCPLKYIEMAPLVDRPDVHNGYAAGWREEVRAYWEKRREGRRLAAALKPGDPITVHGEPWTFIVVPSRRATYVHARDAEGKTWKVRASDILRGNVLRQEAQVGEV
jgi:hypothetical protein